jgi:hypothetical protein
MLDGARLGAPEQKWHVQLFAQTQYMLLTLRVTDGTPDIENEPLVLLKADRLVLIRDIIDERT